MQQALRGSFFLPSAAAVAVATLTVLPLFLVGGLSVQLSADLNVPVGALGAASAAFFGTGALVSPLAGALAARFGARAAMRLSIFSVAVVLVAVGAGVHSLATLLAVLAVGGAGNALAQVSVNLYLAQRVLTHQQGTAYGIKQSAIPVAGVLAGLAVPLLGLTVGWRWAFMVFVLPAVALAVYTPGDRMYAGTVQKRANHEQLPRRTLRKMSVGGGLAAAAATCLGVFLVPGAVQAGWSEAHAGLVFATASGTGILARLIAGVQADRRGARHLEAIALMLGLGAMGFIALATGHPMLYIAGAVIAFGLGWGWPGLLILSAVQLSSASPAVGTALVQVGTSAGAVLGPLLFGVLIEKFSYSIAWGTAGSGLVVAAAIILSARRQANTELAVAERPCCPTLGGTPGE